MIQGETEKASLIYENALVEYNVYEMKEGDSLLTPGNYDLQSLIYNYIKCNAMVQAPSSMSQENYKTTGL